MDDASSGGLSTVEPSHDRLRMPRPRRVVPADTRARQGGWLLLLSLGVFFVGSLLTYLLAVASQAGKDRLAQIQLPGALLLSTVCLIVVSYGVQTAAWAIRRDRFATAERGLRLAFCLSLVFLAVQADAISRFLLSADILSARNVAAMAVTLAVLHGLHVLGGVIALAAVERRIQQGRYDHERHWAVDFCALYWHFLDVVWVCLLISFWLTTGGFVGL